MELAGKRVLVLEDDYLIGLELERIAVECGAKSVQILATVEELTDWVQSGASGDIAIIEVQARGASSLPAASLLRARGIPIVFTTAYEPERNGIAGFEGTPLVGKPYGKTQIVQAISLLRETAFGIASRQDDGSSGELV